MNSISNFLYSYIFLILLWGAINLILYTLSYLVRKNLSSLTVILTYLIDFGVQIYLFCYSIYILWQILIAKQWLLLILAFIFGGFIIGWWQAIYSILLAPFHFISYFFTTKVQESIDKPVQEYEAEYISPEGKMIGKFQSEDKTNKLLAKWSLILFATLFLHQFSTQVDNKGIGLGWFIISPMIVMAIVCAVIALLLGIWNSIKHKSFFVDNKKVFILKCLKITSIIYIISLVINLIFR